MAKKPYTPQEPVKGRGGSTAGRLAVLLTIFLVLLALTACAQPTPAVQEPAVQQPAAQEPAAQEVEPTNPPPTEEPTDIPPTEEPTEPPAAEPTEELVEVDHTAFIAAWESSPHADNYDLGKGPNTYCSRCHSPQNWDPEATVDRPPNCVTCKFPTDESLRMASTMGFVEEQDWKGIGCETCHPVVDDVVQAEVAWLNPITMEHESVATPNELCEKCHATTSGVAASGGRGVTHQIVLGGSAHLNWAGALPQERRPQYCSECHNPHSAQPKDCLDCHEDLMDMDIHMHGQQEAHADVTCMACHDASGLEVGPQTDEEGNTTWVTLVSSVSRSGEATTEYVHSHSIQWLVDCSRCHFEENPWDLSVLTAEGQPPEAETTSN